ncbi:MAG: hypothetical protein K6C40_08605 [Thermoguttaceae bacterium]|nr:hypothetical protein [Thermoguttaceae bacterium]
MFDEIIEALFKLRAEIPRHVQAPPTEKEEILRELFLSESPSLLNSLSLSRIALENIRYALDVKHQIQAANLVDSSTCLFVHGSTGRGNGQVAPNIEFTLTDRPKIQMETYTIPDCRDDIDLVLVAEKPERYIPRLDSIVRQTAAEHECEITLNVLDYESLYEELADPGSPAIRRVLALNHPKALINPERLGELCSEASARLSFWDVPHEIDFKLLMRTAPILNQYGRNAYTFTSSHLIMLFPTLYHAGKGDINIGFPKRRTKIKYTGKTA